MLVPTTGWLATSWALLVHGFFCLACEVKAIVAFVVDLITSLPLVPDFVATKLGRRRHRVKMGSSSIAEGATMYLPRVPFQPKPAANTNRVVLFQGVPYASLSSRFDGPRGISYSKGSEGSRTAVLNPVRWWREGYPIGSRTTVSPQRAAFVVDTPSALTSFRSAWAYLFNNGVAGNALECLQLDVMVEESHLIDSMSKGSKKPLKPVMVFFHGGAFTLGSCHTKLHSGHSFAAAEKDGCVYVTANYRTGSLGFLHLRGAPINRGLLDQIEALRWVKRNIASFGGDPNRLTVSGHSAGAMSLAGLLGTPIVHDEGLLEAAILFSGNAQFTLNRADADLACTEMFRAVEAGKATKRRNKLQEGLLPSSSSSSSDDESTSDVSTWHAKWLRRLETLPLHELVEAGTVVETGGLRQVQYWEACRYLPLSPMFDPADSIFDEHPVRVIENRVTKGLPMPRLLLGTTDSEYTLITNFANSPMMRSTANLGEHLVEEKLRMWLAPAHGLSYPIEPSSPKANVDSLTEAVERIASSYRGSPLHGRAIKPYGLWNTFNTEWIFRLPTEHLAAIYSQARPTYVYRFDRHSVVPQLGAPHAMDMHYFFDNMAVAPYLGEMACARDRSLATQMLRDVLTFVSASSDAEFQEETGWRPYNAERRTCTVYGSSHVEPIGALRCTAASEERTERDAFFGCVAELLDHKQHSAWGDACERHIALHHE